MGDLRKRFDGPENRQRLLEAVQNQKLLRNDAKQAEAFVNAGALQELAPGDILVKQGAWDDDIYFILAGEIDVIINGHPQASRVAGEHVGELSGLNPARSRTATLKASGECLVLKLPRKIFEDAARSDSAVALRMADVLADRLDERNGQIGKANERPRVFVISSSEAKPVVDKILLHLDSKDIAVHSWDMGTFGVSDYPISSLMDAIAASDFTISVVRGDDQVVSRGKSSVAARDNVHLEYGISLGTLGRRRSILLVCASDDVHLPTDTSGLTTLRYRDETPDDLMRSVRNACIKARDHILAEGVFVDRKA